jgi:hypothetical protein
METGRQELDIYPVLQLVTREAQPEGTIVTVQGIPIGGQELVVVAGPCAVESEEQLLATARAVPFTGGVSGDDGLSHRRWVSGRKTVNKDGAMNMKKALLLAMVMTLGVSLLFGADFWTKKKYADWSQKEVQQMLKGSPWAHAVDMRIGGGRSGGGGSGGGGGRRGGSGGGGSLGDASGGGGSGGGSAQGSVEMVPAINLVMRWDSALPVKQAMAKQLADAGGGISFEAAKLLERKETQYVISISGVPSRMLGSDPNRFRPTAFLNIKGKDPIKADSVKTGRDQANAVLYLLFPRSSLIVLEDQEVEVALKAGPIDVKRKFKLKEMVFEGKLEL